MVYFFGNFAALTWLKEVGERAFDFGGGAGGGGWGCKDEEAHGFLELLEELGGFGREGGEVLVGEFKSALCVFFCWGGEVGAN